MITAASILEQFRRIVDETQTDYFGDSEIYGFFNDAQLVMFNQLTDPNAVAGSIPGKNAYWESSQKISKYVQVFLKDISGSFTSSAIETSSLESTLGRTIWGIRSTEVKHKDGSFKHADWKRQAEKVIQSNLAFYRASECNPWITTEPGGYKIHPEGEGDYRGYAIVYPLDISATVDSEFDPGLKNMLVYQAALLAGISIRDNEFVQSIEKQIRVLGV